MYTSVSKFSLHYYIPSREKFLTNFNKLHHPMNNFFAVPKYNYIRTSKFFCVIFYINFTIISFPSNITSNNIFPKFLFIAYKKKKIIVKNNFLPFNKFHTYPMSNFLTDAIVKLHDNTRISILSNFLSIIFHVLI